MDGADPDRWSDIATGWSELWGEIASPAWRAVVAATGVGPGSRVLDVGCGSGEFLAHLARLGASPAGIDPAPGMVELARSRVPGADVRLGPAQPLPWPDGSFDVVTAFNALQFAADPVDALAAVSAGLVEVPWEAADEATLVRGVLLGEDPATTSAQAPAVLAAAGPFRTPTGGYRLVNAFRYAAGRTPGRPGGVAQPDSQPQPSPSRSRPNGSGGRTRIGPSTYSGPSPEPPAQS
jgi:SAM-dependent methyltransferase